MKLSRKQKLLILIILCSSIFFIYKQTNNHNINYTVIGDGFAKGIDCYGRIDYGYGDYIKDYLEEKEKLMDYSNTYTDEKMTIDSLLTTIITDKKMYRNNKKNNIIHTLRETDILTLNIGINDLLFKLGLTSDFTEDNLDIIIKEIETSFSELITEIKKVYNREIYVIGYYSPPTHNEFIQRAVKRLNNLFKANENVIYISTTIISENRNIFLSNPDSYYPNYKGYQAISTKIIDKISKKLEK